MERKAMTDYTADELELVDCATGEQEITISGYRSDDRLDVWVSDNVMLTKLKRAMKKAPDAYKLEDIVWTKDGTVAGYKFSMPKKRLRFTIPMSEEGRKNVVGNLNKAAAPDEENDGADEETEE